MAKKKKKASKLAPEGQVLWDREKREKIERHLLDEVELGRHVSDQDFNPALIKLEAKRRYHLSEAERLRQLIDDLKVEAFEAASDRVPHSRDDYAPPQEPRGWARMDRGEKIDVILSSKLGQYLTTKHITEDLAASGEDFGGAPRADALILSALKRHQERFGWESAKLGSGWVWCKPDPEEESETDGE